MPEHSAGPPNPAPGWYPDPQSPSLRWWDGQTWVDKWAPASGTPTFTPLPIGAPARPTTTSDHSEPLQANDFQYREEIEKVASSDGASVPTKKVPGPRWVRSRWSILALAACLFLAAASTVGYFAFRTDPLELQTEQGPPRSIICDWYGGDGKYAVKTPPAIIKSITLTENNDALVEFRARFDPFPTQNKTPNTDGVLRTPVTTLELTLSKTQSVLSRGERAFDKYYLSIRPEDRFAVYLSEDNGRTGIEQPKNIKIFRDDQDVVIQIDPKELPLLPTGKTFGFMAGTWYDGAGFGSSNYQSRDCS